MKMSESIKNLAAAMYAFRKAVKQPKKDKENPFFKSTYVALEGVQKSIDEALPDGLSYTQALITEDGRVGIITIILHKSGEFMAFDPAYVPVTKNDAQGYGSAETYARRYSLSAAFGISSDVDDDGNAASQEQQRQYNSRPNRSTQGRKTSAQAQPKSKTMSAADKKKLALEELITKNAKDMMTTPKDLLIKVIKQAKVKSWKNATVADIDAMNHELQTEIMEQKQQAKKDEAKTPDEQFDELGI